MDIVEYRARIPRAPFDDARDRCMLRTGHDAFDAQNVVIDVGNINAPTLRGRVVHAWSDTRKDDVLRGQRFRRDMQDFDDIDMPDEVERGVREQLRDQNGHLYCIYHWARRYKPVWRDVRIVHGWVLTSERHELLRTWVTGPTFKSSNVVLLMRRHLSWRQEDD